MEQLSNLVPLVLVDGLVALCERTGLYWGPNSRDLFFYRPPANHIVEFVIFHLFVLVLYLLTPSYYRDAVTNPQRKLQESKPRSSLDTILGATYFFCWLFQIVLKSMRTMPLVQLCWMFMPCHLITLLWVYVFLYSSPSTKNFRLCVYLASLATAFHWGPVSAALFPDWSDHKFVVERYVFVLHHGLLVVTPYYFAIRYGLLPFTRDFLIHATWVATFINVGPYTIISYITGLNVNYHLYPPPKLMTLAVFATPYYRYYVIGILVVLTTAFYLSAVGTQKLFTIICRRPRRQQKIE